MLKKRWSERTMGSAAVIGAVVTGGALLWPGAAHSQDRGGFPSVEYAELKVLGLDAVFQTGSQVFYLEGPERNDPVAAENNRTYRVTPSIELFHLNSVGRSGWYVVQQTYGGDRPAFLLARTR